MHRTRAISRSASRKELGGQTVLVLATLFLGAQAVALDRATGEHVPRRSGAQVVVADVGEARGLCELLLGVTAFGEEEALAGQGTSPLRVAGG